MTSWQTVKLKDICAVKGGKRLPKGDSFSDEGFPYIRARDIRNGKITFDDPVYISDRIRDKIKRYTVRKDDICITIVGINIGDVGIVPEFLDNANLTENAAKLFNFGGIYPHYLVSFLRTNAVRELMQLYSSGAAQGKLGLYKIKEIPVSVPPLPTQKKIAAILSAYDDLIENNNRRIALLERAAEEIYREWFVRMRFPGWESTKFEKGVPVGWDVKPVSEVVSIKPTERLEKHLDTPYAGMGDLSETSMVFSFGATRKGGSGSKFRNHDVLFPRITPSVENGKRGYVLGLKDGQIGLGSTEFIVLREKELISEYIYFLSCLPEFRKQAELSMTGASGRQRVQENCFDYFLLKVPPQNIQKEFSKIIKPFFEQIEAIYNKRRFLRQSRDLLLSRLISGKLSVDNLDIHFPPSMIAAEEPAHA